MIWEIREHGALNIIWEIKRTRCFEYNMGNKRTRALNIIWEIREQWCFEYNMGNKRTRCFEYNMGNKRTRCFEYNMIWGNKYTVL